MGVLPTVATRFFPQVVLRFRAVRPDVMLSIETGPHHYLIRLLREGALDLMIGRLPAATDTRATMMAAIEMIDVTPAETAAQATRCSARA